MKHNFFIVLIALQFHLVGVQAQGNISLKYLSKYTVPNDKKVDGSIVGGLSGISYDVKDSTYYVVADKHPSRMYKLTIDTHDALKLDFLSVININPRLLSNSELEGIAIDRAREAIYVADEQTLGTRIFEVGSSGKFSRIITPMNKPFLPLSGYNSGIEGLTLSDDGQELYYAFERPIENCLNDTEVEINHLELKGSNLKRSYHYKLHEVARDKINSNGISEILYLNKTSLLVMERAYIPGTGNVVRIYQVDLIKQEKSSNESCSGRKIFKTTSHLVFDFADVKDFEIDNAEGMTLNADKSRLIIVTDNNFSKKQETQFIVLEVAK